MICLIETKKRDGHGENKYADTYSRMVESATRQLTDGVMKFVKHLSWEEVTKKEDDLSSRE